MTLITFTSPKKSKMASGRECVELTESGDWETFPRFAEKYTKQIGAKVINKSETPDMHLWEIEFEGEILNFIYEDFPNGISIEPKNDTGQDAIDKLFKLATKQSNQGEI